VAAIAFLAVVGTVQASGKAAQVQQQYQQPQDSQSTSPSQEVLADPSDDSPLSFLSSPLLSSPLFFGPAGKIYSLHLHHTHTDESLDVVYRIGNQYIPDALDKLNHFLRDSHTDAVSNYDPHEFDLLHSIMTRLGKPNGIIDIVCGYRTPWTNAMLRHNSPSSGVAEHSQHMEAKAIDIRVPGVQTARLRDTAESFQAGGVGYYPVSQFVHVDVGPVRTWSFGGRSRHPRLRAASLRHRARSHHIAHRAGN
jgi:uncharacterized protein YcbK (DUF882 family)